MLVIAYNNLLHIYFICLPMYIERELTLPRLNTSVDRIENILSLVRSVYIPLYSNINV